MLAVRSFGAYYLHRIMVSYFVATKPMYICTYLRACLVRFTACDYGVSVVFWTDTKLDRKDQLYVVNEVSDIGICHLFV